MPHQTAAECRANAASCLKQAELETPPGRITLLAVAHQWIKLAADMESSETLLEVMNHIDRTWEDGPKLRAGSNGDGLGGET